MGASVSASQMKTSSQKQPALTADEDQRLYQRFSRVAPLTRKTWRAMLAPGRRQRLARGAFFSRPGESAAQFAIVLEGVLRHYYVDPKGREHVKDFSIEGDLAAPYAEMISRAPSRTYIEAIAPSELLVFEIAAFDALASRSLEVARFARALSDGYFVAKEQREYEFLQLTAEERYRQFCQRSPAVVQHVPLYQVASYIGVTPVALSRIRARLKRR